MKAEMIGSVVTVHDSGTLSDLAAGVLKTDDRIALTLLRLTVAVVLFPHGAQHALGWFGGYGFAGTERWMTQTLGFPGALAALAIVTEIAAPVALALGFGGRVAALGIAGIMLGAIRVHAANGFFMNWFGQLPPAGEGFEYHLLMLGMTAVLAVEGSGAFSLDRLFRTHGGTGNDPRRARGAVVSSGAFPRV